MCNTEAPAVVIDFGACTFKAGFAGEENPRVDIPPIFLPPRHLRASQYKPPCAVVDYCNDLPMLEKVWHHSYDNLLTVSPEEHPVFIAEKPSTIALKRKKLREVLFETFHIPALGYQNQADLVLQASGRDTGIWLDIGHGEINVIPIINGQIINHAVRQLKFGGFELTEYFQRLITQIDYRANTSADLNVVRDIQKKLCYVALDFGQETAKAASSIGVDFELPDGNVITIADQLFLCPEALFNPILLGRSCEGVHETLHEVIAKCPIDNRRDLGGNIALCGGGTLYAGFPKRLQKETEVLFSQNFNIKIIKTPNRLYSSWCAASMLASDDAMPNNWITKEQYEEYGSC